MSRIYGVFVNLDDVVALTDDYKDSDRAFAEFWRGFMHGSRGYQDRRAVGAWSAERCDGYDMGRALYEDARARHEKRSTGGKKGAGIRWGTDAEPNGLPNGLPIGLPNGNPNGINHEPLTINEEPATRNDKHPPTPSQGEGVSDAEPPVVDEVKGEEDGGRSQRRRVRQPGASVLAPGVEEIYAAYPLKKKRPAALHAIDKAVRQYGAAYVLEKTQAYAAAVAAANVPPDRKRYIPHPATWFNGEQYNDDPDTWTAHLTEPVERGRGGHRAPVVDTKVRDKYTAELIQAGTDPQAAAVAGEIIGTYEGALAEARKRNEIERARFEAAVQAESERIRGTQ